MKVNKNEFFRQATLRICGSLNIESALDRCIQYLEIFLPVDAISLSLYDPAQNVLQRIAKVARHSEVNLSPVWQLPEGGKSIWPAKWAHMDNIEIVNRPASRPEVREVLEMHSLSLDVSLLFMRLELEGQRVGFLMLQTLGTDRYTDAHSRWMLMLHEPFAIAMKNAMQHQELIRLKDMLTEDNHYLRRQIRDLSISEIIGADEGLKHVMEMVRQVAKLNSPVLLLGETGVGKGLIANAIHYASARNNGPFVSVNCGAIPETLYDSELFGHEKGAFTGAINRKKGRFERAGKGTIFLDEIGELPPQAQVRLLHVFQERFIERVGGTAPVPVDVRIVCATHRNLEEMIRTGQFREDLWFRLNVFPIQIPPLRQRKEDISTLAYYFIEKKSIALKLQEKPRLAPGAIDQLTDYDWPGNVRELENIIERAIIQQGIGPLRFNSLIFRDPGLNKILAKENAGNSLLSLDEINTMHIRQALTLANGKINGPGGAAQLLQIHPNTLRKRMDKLNIAYKRKKLS